jgi:NAD(P)-dependent dehydrogenase (short-subunit alcohol dehydrogenase family)
MRVVVTGASRGLGLGLCAVLARRGDEVVALCRHSTPELDALGAQVVEGIDVAEEEAASKLRALSEPSFVDALICNAGISRTFNEDIDNLDLAAVEEEYRVNAVGAVRVVQALLPRLHGGSRIVLVTGGGTRSLWPAVPGIYGYRMSKAALNAFGFLLAEELRPRGISVLIVSPGVMDTDMHRSSIAVGRGSPDTGVSPLEAARGVVARMDELDVESTGAFLHASGRPLGD